MTRIRVSPLLIAVFMSFLTYIVFYALRNVIAPWIDIGIMSVPLGLSSVILIVTFGLRKAKIAYWGLQIFILVVGLVYFVAVGIIPLYCTIIIFVALLVSIRSVIKFLAALFELEIIFMWKKTPTEPGLGAYEQGYQWSSGGKIQENQPLQGQGKRSQSIPPLEIPQQQ